MRYTAESPLSDLPIIIRHDEPEPQFTKFMYYPMIKCLDCFGRLYPPGPALGATNFELHLKSSLHREKVERRLEMVQDSTKEELPSDPSEYHQ